MKYNITQTRGDKKSGRILAAPNGNKNSKNLRFCYPNEMFGSERPINFKVYREAGKFIDKSYNAGHNNLLFASVKEVA